MSSKIIIHVDLDAFFAAVEQRDRPEFRGKPVIVGADPKQGTGRGVVSTCSYEARKFGVHSAMPISIAYKRCPHAVFLPVDFEKYRRVSSRIFEIFSQFTPDLEPISIDEAFLDITASYHLFGTPYAAGLKIKERIKNQLGLTASVGIAPVKMVAKIASSYCKPDGLLEIKEGGVEKFLSPLTIDKLWGVGPKTQRALQAIGIKTIGDLARTPLRTLQRLMGEHGEQLYQLACGRDDREVVVREEAKSVSHEHTFDVDTRDRLKIQNVLLDISERLSRRLRKENLKGKTLTVKIRLKGFKTYTRCHTLPQRTNYTDEIYKTARSLFENFYKEGDEIRLLGIRVTNFADPYVRDSLFSDPIQERLEKVHRAVDLIKDRFGEEAIHRAG